MEHYDRVSITDVIILVCFLGSKIDRSKVPKLVEKDIEEKYIRGIIENNSV